MCNKVLESVMCLLDLAQQTTLVISNEEMDDIMKIDKCLEESGLLMKRVSKTNKIEAIKLKGGFLSICLGTVGASLLGNLWSGKRRKAKIPGGKVIKEDDGNIRAGQDF